MEQLKLPFESSQTCPSCGHAFLHRYATGERVHCARCGVNSVASESGILYLFCHYSPYFHGEIDFSFLDRPFAEIFEKNLSEWHGFELIYPKSGAPVGKVVKIIASQGKRTAHVLVEWEKYETT